MDHPIDDFPTACDRFSVECRPALQGLSVEQRIPVRGPAVQRRADPDTSRTDSRAGQDSGPGYSRHDGSDK